MLNSPMPKIILVQLKKVIEVNFYESFFQILRKNDIPIASSCQGRQICGRCSIEIIHGSEFLNSPDENEMQVSKKYGWQQQNCGHLRAACSTYFVKNGTVEVKTTYW
ncbi:MAG: 2Fe-2S iron-sulfur cluster-binding protein [bacterium]|nr:2Fe-2S iron-sulfur cluster-binding protein [bacterium]